MPLLLLALDPEAEPKDGTDQKRQHEAKGLGFFGFRSGNMLFIHGTTISFHRTY